MVKEVGRSDSGGGYEMILKYAIQVAWYVGFLAWIWHDIPKWSLLIFLAFTCARFVLEDIRIDLETRTR
jgi:hypothetical protein